MMTPWLFFLLHPTYFSPWPLIVSLMTTGSIWPTERKGKKKKKKPGRENNQKKASKKKQYSHNFIWIPYGKKGVSGFTLCEQYPFHPPLFTRVVSLAAGNFIQPSPYTPGPLFDYALLFPLFESGTQRGGGGKGIKKSQPSFPFSSLLEAAKKSLFLAEGFLFVWSFCEGKDTECQKIISLQGKTVQPDFFSNPVQIHSNGEQGCCSLFFPPPPPPPLSLITRPQRKAPPFYSPQKGRGETCASVSAASFLQFRRRRPSPLHTNATLCPSFRGRGNRSPWRQIPKFEQFIYICIQVLKKLPKT